MRCSTVSTVHDMNYELGYLPKNFGATINILERKRSYFDAQSLICISEQTKKELLEIYPQLRERVQIDVIHHGCEFVHSTPTDRIEASALGRYILFVGGRQNYKRFDDLLYAFETSVLKHEGFKIVCTGAPFSDNESEQIRKLNLEKQVVPLGKVSPPYLSALYESAYCLVYPSLHEGFGMPLIEAMQHSCPVIACNISCMPEIAADAAILVPPRSPESIGAALIKLQDASVRANQIDLGLKRAGDFSWDQSAQAHMAVYKQAATRLDRS
jgi:glycosyltransferase involved in cell wall biosynthesis